VEIEKALVIVANARAARQMAASSVVAAIMTVEVVPLKP
jgi:hypothetical protein